jgi:hypothetical protein
MNAAVCWMVICARYPTRRPVSAAGRSPSGILPDASSFEQNLLEQVLLAAGDQGAGEGDLDLGWCRRADQLPGWCQERVPRQ